MDSVNVDNCGESSRAMVLWGQSAESRDVTHVLLSPRMGGCKSPLNRKMPSKKAIEMVEPCAFLDHVFKSSEDCEDGEDVLGNGDDGHGDFQSLPSSKRMSLEPSVSVGDLYKDYVTQLSRQFSVQGKKGSSSSSGSKYTGFYIFAFLVFMFLLVKISSLGWLAVQTHSASSPMVLTNDAVLPSVALEFKLECKQYQWTLIFTELN